VLVAVNGKAAIDILSEMGGQVDLILADVVMPVAGGEAISDFLRDAQLKTPIIYTSGYTLRSGPADFLQREAVTLLRKPYSLSQLLATVKDALAVSRPGGNSP
jgi:two-component system cell cycle sensor histidine kinase/response regulator CckA